MVFGRKKKVHASLEIVVEKLHYEAGEFITGNVVFQKVRAPSPTATWPGLPCLASERQ